MTRFSLISPDRRVLSPVFPFLTFSPPPAPGAENNSGIGSVEKWFCLDRTRPPKIATPPPSLRASAPQGGTRLGLRFTPARFTHFFHSTSCVLFRRLSGALCCSLWQPWQWGSSLSCRR